MKSRSFLVLAVIASAASGLLIPNAMTDETTVPNTDGKPAVGEDESATKGDDAIPRVSLAVARDRAKLLHEVYASTLDVMHHRYFHSNRAVVPARALEDVFSDLKRQSHIEARWIAVNMKAMSLDHVPETEFEKQAAREIGSGKDNVEKIESGYYRRAEAIPLTGGCITCHGGFFKKPSKTAKYAGLVISIPIQDGTDSEK